ncbi:hypothetical protein CUMW_245680 [Citrus unshiu]|uniref:Pre-mRNA-processing factor 17 n=1 Tax=Citrus unshiu TaxID=55188 RepID=A0A2H5QN59_CITUN|nr:hypothetical protein CUMW_245680 [Citrus unshiu]
MERLIRVRRKGSFKGRVTNRKACNALEKNNGVSVYNIRQNEQKKRKLEKKQEAEEVDGTAVDVDPAEFNNPATDTWLMKNRKSPWAGKKEGVQTELSEEQKKYAEEYAKKKEEKGNAGGEKGEHVEDKSTFHGKEETDYQGRSWIAPPKDAKAANDHCYIPKRLVHTWSGHTKGVSAIRFFPKYGHLILSAGMDTKVKIWDVVNSGKCMRTYMGHSKAVRDISFCNDGTKFLTASYDKNIKYWDTETGQVIRTFSTGKIPYAVKLNPDDDKQNILLAGMSDKKIVQWDMNTKEITQEYDQHLGAVNTITFVDSNRRFVTSSDDKSLRVWEFGIPVVIKYISEPHMHSMPSISLHPNTNWLAAQSLDNQILIYSTRERFQLNKKKRFAGHIVAGYACQVNFSPDGRFVMSGDGEGKCWFWDWKSCKVFRTLKCHEGVCIGCEWHPLEQSKVATCGWDGLIKYWFILTKFAPFHLFDIYRCPYLQFIHLNDEFDAHGLAFSFASDGMDQSGETYLTGRLQESNWTWLSFEAVAATYIWDEDNIWAHCSCADELEGHCISLKDILTASDDTKETEISFFHLQLLCP